MTTDLANSPPPPAPRGSARSRTTSALPEVESLAWPDVRRILRTYWARPTVAKKQGQHAAIYAPTGTGKTYLWTRCLAPLWSHTLTLDLKIDDPDNRKHAAYLGAKRLPIYPQPDVARLWGKDPYPAGHYWIEPTEHNIVPQFAAALDHVFYKHTEAIKVVYVDEFKLFAARPPDGHGMFAYSNRLLRLARGRGISFIGGTQDTWWMGPGGSDLKRQSRWIFIGRTTDEDSLDAYKGISGLPKALIYEVLPTLGKHEWFCRSLDLDMNMRFTPPGPRQITAARRQHTERRQQTNHARTRFGLPTKGHQ